MAENENAAPPKPAEPPKTPDIVGDNNGKEIRKLQERVATAEKKNQDFLAELLELRDIVGGLAKLPPKTPDPAQPRKSLLDEVNEILFGSKAQ